MRFAAQGGVHRHIIGGGWLKLAPGQVTDDTTMSLALGQALLDGQRLGRPFDTVLIAEAFLAWWRGRPVDCGNTCRRGILRYRHDGSLSGPVNDADGGNGALMRNLPVALATLGDDALFDRMALAQARITHHHPLSDAAVLGIGHLLRGLLAGADPDRQRAAVDAWVAAHPGFRFSPYPGRAGGYVVDTVQTVLHSFTRTPTSKPRWWPPSTRATTPTPPVHWWACWPAPAAVPPRCRRTGCAGCHATWCTPSPPRPVRWWRWRCRPPTPPLPCPKDPAMPIHDFRCSAHLRRGSHRARLHRLRQHRARAPGLAVAPASNCWCVAAPSPPAPPAAAPRWNAWCRDRTAGHQPGHHHRGPPRRGTRGAFQQLLEGGARQGEVSA
jgi:ADP-ribosyl-[dinitrogen reductase] hydrolase